MPLDITHPSDDHEGAQPLPDGWVFCIEPKMRKCKGSIVVVVLDLVTPFFDAVFTDGYLDPLTCEAFAKRRTLNHTGKFLGRVDGEGLGEGRGQDGAFAGRDDGIGALANANIAHA